MIKKITKLLLVVLLIEWLGIPSLAVSASTLASLSAMDISSLSSSLSTLSNLDLRSSAAASGAVSAGGAGTTSGDQFYSLSYVPNAVLPESYQLGPGDSIMVNMISYDQSLNLTRDFTINPEGKIFFPNLGEIELNNLTLKQAKAAISKKIAEVYPDPFTLSVMIMQPKQIRVFVSGQAENFGYVNTYAGEPITAFMARVKVLDGGSKRNVVIHRKDQLINIDLYQRIFYGSNEPEEYVRLGDVIEVPLASAVRVKVMGEVPRPGIYELKAGEKTKNALVFAGMTKSSSALSKVAYLKRQKEKDDFDNYQMDFYDLFNNPNTIQNLELFDGDIISVPSIKMFVYVYGEVVRPGRYDMVPGYKVSDYLNLAGGPTSRASLSSVELNRPVENGGQSQVFKVNANDILKRGQTKNDMEVYGGDVISVPGNFFYFQDFASFANTIILALTVYTMSRNTK
jgi:protein involved in polysaccharide export with SLBB domain